MKAYARVQLGASAMDCVERTAEKSGRMDTMEVNKGIAAVLVVGIVFFLAGWIGDNLVTQTEPSKPALDIKTTATAGASSEAAKPAPLAPVSPLLASADPAAGEAYTRRVCTVCHTFTQGGHPLVGPNLYGVVTAPHDHEVGFNYSPALEKLKGQPWTYEALNEWLFKPSQVAPGTRMTFAGIPSAKDRANVIAYLRTLSPTPVPLPSAEAAAAPAAAPATPPAPAAAPAAGTTAPTATQPATRAPARPPAAPAPATAAPPAPAPAASAGSSTPGAPSAGAGAPAAPGTAAPASPAPAAATPPSAAGAAPPSPPAPEVPKKP
jgi:cytochrome c